MNVATCSKVDCPSSLENNEKWGLYTPFDKNFLYLLSLDMASIPPPLLLLSLVVELAT